MFDWLAKGKKTKAEIEQGGADGPAAQTVSKTEDEILQWLVEKLASLNGLTPERVDPSMSFSYYGLDSVAAVGLAGELEEWLERKFSASLLFTLLFSRPSVADLAKHLASRELEK